MNYINLKLTCIYLLGGILSSAGIAETHAAFISQNPSPSVILKNHGQYSLEGQIKIKSFPKTAQDALLLYREAGATPQQIATPYIFLSLLGHPNYPTISPDKNVCIFIFSSPEQSTRKYILMAKLEESSNLKKIIENLGWGINEYQGWTFFTKNKDDFQIINDKNALVNYGNENTKTDIEFTTNPTLISLTSLKGDKDFNKALANVDRAIFNIDFSKDQISVNASFKHKGDNDSFPSWLEKNGNCWGITTKLIHKYPKESKLCISLERKNLAHFINQLKTKVLSMNVQ